MLKINNDVERIDSYWKVTDVVNKMYPYCTPVAWCLAPNGFVLCLHSVPCRFLKRFLVCDFVWNWWFEIHLKCVPYLARTISHYWLLLGNSGANWVDQYQHRSRSLAVTPGPGTETNVVFPVSSRHNSCSVHVCVCLLHVFLTPFLPPCHHPPSPPLPSHTHALSLSYYVPQCQCI